MYIIQVFLSMGNATNTHVPDIIEQSPLHVKHGWGWPKPQLHYAYIYLQKWNVTNRECARHYWTYLSTWATQNKLASNPTTICNAKQQICARQFWTISSICGGQNMLALIPTTLYRCIFLSAMQPKENVPDIIGQSHPCAAHSNVI